MDGDSVALEDGDEPAVLLLDEVEVRRLVTLPVPTLVRIDERAEPRIPPAGFDPLELARRLAHEDGAEPAHVAVGAPPRAPNALPLVGIVERRLGNRRKEAVVIPRRK